MSVYLYATFFGDSDCRYWRRKNIVSIMHIYPNCIVSKALVNYGKISVYL